MNLNTKKDILKNVGNQTVDGPHWLPQYFSFHTIECRLLLVGKFGLMPTGGCSPSHCSSEKVCQKKEAAMTWSLRLRARALERIEQTVHPQGERKRTWIALLFLWAARVVFLKRLQASRAQWLYTVCFFLTATWWSVDLL